MNCPHCEIDINKHEATRCLDAWVAEQVMGWKPYRIVTFNILYPPNMQKSADEHSYLYRQFDPEREYDFDSAHFFDSRAGGFTQPIVPKYSTEIEIAWRVADALTSMNWKVFIGMDLKDGNYCRLEWNDPFDSRWNQFMDRSKSVPLAICRAALKASEK